MGRTLLLVGLCLCLWTVGQVRAVENAQLKRLLEQGITVGESSLKLPAPVLADGLDAAAQKKAIEAVADPSKPFAELTRKSVVAPFVIKTQSKPLAKSQLWQVDLYFVVYGELDKITEENLRAAESEAKPDEDPALTAKAITLDAAALSSRQIKSGAGERYVHSAFAMFERVRVAGVLHTVETRTKESVVVAALLDDRFATDKEFPSYWQSLTRDDAGKLKIDATRHPYAAAGMYAKATKLAEPAGALFVEYHVVFDEPQGWFNGANLIVSKLPLVAQNEIRALRRRVGK